MDEVQIQTISERWGYIQHLNQRKDEVIRLIDEQGKLTGQLKLDIEKADKLQEVEDLYRPFKQKRKTKATIAKSKGLEPLADFIIALPRNEDVIAEARKYINEEKEVMSAEEALEGAKTYWLNGSQTNRNTESGSGRRLLKRNAEIRGERRRSR